MNKKPLVTIVTITFNLKDSNRVAYFRQCLESVHNQTYGRIEHIVIDGGSRDGTLEIIKEYASKGWITYISEPDNGVYDAMNKGIKMAKGKYIAFLNSDDYYHNPQAVELSVKELERTGADYSFSNTRSVNAETEEEIGTWYGNINLIPFGTHYCHQSMFTKTSLLRALGGFDVSHAVSADSDLMIKLIAMDKKHVFIPERLVTYRSGGISNLHSGVTREEHSRAFYQYLGKKNGLTEEDCSLLWNFSIFSEKSFFYCIKFGKKLTKPEWRDEYYKRLFSFSNFKNLVKKKLPWQVVTKLVFLNHLLKGDREYYDRLGKWISKKIKRTPDEKN